jgi:hypothetical protein
MSNDRSRVGIERHNNCFFWAHGAYIKMRAAWYLHGRPTDREPIIYARPGDVEPSSVNHWLVAYINRHTNQLSEIRSFKPVNPRKGSWWIVWTRFIFKGKVVDGDPPPSRH